MENLSINNINFIKSKNTTSYKKTKQNNTYKKNYGIVNKKNERIVISINNVYIPFGIERYNDRDLINIELNPQKNNQHYNLNVILSEFEKELKNTENLKDNYVLRDIEQKNFHSNIKQNNQNFLIRTHIFGTPDIYTNINGKKFPIIDIKKKHANMEIELLTLWITDDNYGILFNIKSVEII